MLRMASAGFGGLLVGLGFAWFYSSTLDDIALLVAGNPVSPLTKMMLGDTLSFMFGGLSVTGLILLWIGLWSDGQSDRYTPA